MTPMSLTLFLGFIVSCSGLVLPVACSRLPVAYVRHESCHMAGFGGAAASGKQQKATKAKAVKKSAAKKELSAKRQWDKFKELVSNGSDRIACYAMAPGSKWVQVGEVAVEAPGTGAQAALFNKRLILEHAPRVQPSLQLRTSELIAGIAGPDGEPIILTKEEVPPNLQSGFEGVADASGKYTKVRGTTLKSDPTAIMGSAAR